ncbi:hypothetical protein [Microtetraspora malaysiensis]|uniref:hypothetical protein n=1 Tax=Microtetraspora malaysiensis TaxID=161358 RepID=UPI003D8A793E
MAALAAGLAILTACGTSAFSEEQSCTEMAARRGISLDIPAPYAAKVAEATMKICWNGACVRPEVSLMDTGETVPQNCTGNEPDDSCAASSSPDGGKRGFADVGDLPAAPVQVAVTLRDAEGKRLLAEEIDVTPHVTYPNGRQCGEGDPQAGLIVLGGKVTVRR